MFSLVFPFYFSKIWGHFSFIFRFTNHLIFFFRILMKFLSRSGPVSFRCQLGPSLVFGPCLCDRSWPAKFSEKCFLVWMELVVLCGFLNSVWFFSNFSFESIWIGNILFGLFFRVSGFWILCLYWIKRLYLFLFSAWGNMRSFCFIALFFVAFLSNLVFFSFSWVSFYLN